MKKLLLLTLLLYNTVFAFTYQGELTHLGGLHHGSVDMSFRLYDASSGGNQVGFDDDHSGIAVANGRFIVTLDQWVGLFDGTPLWLEIAVDIDQSGTFTPLSPRQKLEPAVYAEFAYDGAGGIGDITSINVSHGLSGGGDSGPISLQVDDTVIQNRITGSCSSGQSIRTINEDGTVICEDDNDSGGDIMEVIAGSGLIGGGISGSVSLDVDDSIIQNRIVGSCLSGESIRVINIDGTVTCETDNDSGGDITRVIAGEGLSGGGFAGDVTLNVNSSVFQSRVSSNCPAGQAIRSIHQDGTVTCEVDDSLSVSSVWSRTGNSGTNSNTDFIGTTDERPFHIRVNNKRVSKFVPNPDFSSMSIINGIDVNEISFSTAGSVIAGGGQDTNSCGISNNASCRNYITGYGYNTISGGMANLVNGSFSTVSGGIENVISGNSSVIPGGKNNYIGSDSSWAGGSSAIVNFGHNGTFVWDGDHSTANELNSSAPGQFLLRAPGGFWLSSIDGDLTPSPNATMHVASAAGDVALRVQVDGNTEFKVESNGGVAIGGNYSWVPAEGLKVKGDTEILGSLSKGGGSFKIDHPLDPENKYLYHSFVESPDMMNVYNGNITTDQRGEAWVELPDWFETLNRDFRYQLTVIGSFDRAMIAREVADNRFLIQTESPHVKVSWQVTGIRHDPWAEKNRIPVEEEKPLTEKGKYLHPKAWSVGGGKNPGNEEEE